MELMDNATSADLTKPCAYCGMRHATKCPLVRAIEYFENGLVKRVEFMTPSDYLAPISTLPIETSKIQFGPPYPIGTGSVSASTERVMSWGCPG
jgi:hypothetical protein